VSQFHDFTVVGCEEVGFSYVPRQAEPNGENAEDAENPLDDVHPSPTGHSSNTIHLQ